MNKAIDLKEEFEREQQVLCKIAEDFPWENAQAYAYWLGQTFCYVKRSTRILALAAAHFPLNHNTHHYRFIEHAREEKGHEKLILNDLKTLNWKLEDIPELPEMTAFYQSLYYWIEHIHPVGLFGWVFCLEGLAVKKGGLLHGRVKKAFGEKASTFWKVHSAEDVTHLASAFEVLNSVSEQEKKMILDNFHQCCTLYGLTLTKIQSLCAENKNNSFKNAA